MSTPETEPTKLRVDPARWKCGEDSDEYHCGLCRDTYRVTIYSRQTMKLAIKAATGELEFEQVKLTTCVCWCKCSKAKQLCNAQGGGITLEHGGVVPVSIRSSNEGRRLEILEWAQKFFEKKNAPFKAFDDFNNGIDF